MKKEEYLYRCEDETGTITLQKNGEDVAINTYNAARSELLNKVDKVLINLRFFGQHNPQIQPLISAGSSKQ